MGHIAVFRLTHWSLNSEGKFESLPLAGPHLCSCLKPFLLTRPRLSQFEKKRLTAKKMPGAFIDIR